MNQESPQYTNYKQELRDAFGAEIARLETELMASTEDCDKLRGALKSGLDLVDEENGWGNANYMDGPVFGDAYVFETKAREALAATKSQNP